MALSLHIRRIAAVLRSAQCCESFCRTHTASFSTAAEHGVSLQLSTSGLTEEQVSSTEVMPIYIHMSSRALCIVCGVSKTFTVDSVTEKSERKIAL